MMTKVHPFRTSLWKSSKPVQETRSTTLQSPELYMFALTVSTVEPKNIKEEVVDSAWIEAILGYELPPSLVYFLCQSFQCFWRHASHTELFDQEVESFSWQGFGEDVSHIEHNRPPCGCSPEDSD
ncbi:hypothetical protein Tco_0045894 [Tanacetum coccineum]